MDFEDDALACHPIPSGPKRVSAQRGAGCRVRGRDWSRSLHDLHTSLESPSARSRRSIEWALHRWASEALRSAVIRIDGSEGLIGPPPARWRLLAHISDGRSFALAILDGRAPLAPANVLAASLCDAGGRGLIAARHTGLSLVEGRGGIDDPTAITALLDALQSRVAPTVDLDALPLDLGLAFSLLSAEALAGGGS